MPAGLAAPSVHKPRLLDADKAGFGNLCGLVPGCGGQGLAACSGVSRYGSCSAAHEARQ